MEKLNIWIHKKRLIQGMHSEWGQSEIKFFFSSLDEAKYSVRSIYFVSFGDFLI